MAAEDPYPLFDLPRNIPRKVIRRIFPDRLFGIALLSKKAKRHIEASKLIDRGHLQKVHVRVHSYTEVAVPFTGAHTLRIYFYVPRNALTEEICEPTEFVVFWADMPGQLRWTNTRSLTIKDVIDRVKSIFQRKYVLLSFHPNSNRYDPALIRGVVENIKFSYLPATTSTTEDF